MPSKNDVDKKGDLFVEFKVELPEKLSAAQKKEIEKTL